MSVHLHLQRVALWLRLLLVCLVLSGVSAAAPTMGYREAVVAIATVVTAQAPEERLATAAPVHAPERTWPPSVYLPLTIALHEMARAREPHVDSPR